MVLILFLIFSYLLGSIPFGLLIGKHWIGLDLRTQGSGNIGATNMVRVGGRLPGILTFILDVGKGALAVWLAQIYLVADSESILILKHSLIGITAILGHVFPIFLKFKGGKGIATLFGVFAVLHFPIGLVTGFIWLGTFVAKKVSSLSSLVALVVMPFLFLLVPWIVSESILFIQFFMFSGLSIILIYRHRENIGRLLSGEESKLKSGQKNN